MILLSPQGKLKKSFLREMFTLGLVTTHVTFVLIRYVYTLISRGLHYTMIIPHMSWEEIWNLGKLLSWDARLHVFLHDICFIYRPTQLKLDNNSPISSTFCNPYLATIQYFLLWLRILLFSHILVCKDLYLNY